MQFKPEVFVSSGSRLSSNRVTIIARGGFLFSAGVVHKYRLIDYQYCILSYDKTSRVIFFSFSNNKAEAGSIKITHRHQKNSSLTSTSFFTFFHLDPAKLTGAYDVQEVSINKLFTIAIFLDKKLPKRGEK